MKLIKLLSLRRHKRPQRSFFINQIHTSDGESLSQTPQPLGFDGLFCVKFWLGSFVRALKRSRAFIAAIGACHFLADVLTSINNVKTDLICTWLLLFSSTYLRVPSLI